jgi:hypothetical protein
MLSARIQSHCMSIPRVSLLASLIVIVGTILILSPQQWSPQNWITSTFQPNNNHYPIEEQQQERNPEEDENQILINPYGNDETLTNNYHDETNNKISITPTNNNNNNLDDLSDCTLPITSRFQDLLFEHHSSPGQQKQQQQQKQQNVKYTSANPLTTFKIHDKNFLLPISTTSENNIQPFNNDTLTNQVIFTFIHLNKAGGTFMKENVFAEASLKQHWDGEGWGTVVGWNLLEAGCDNDHKQHSPNNNNNNNNQSSVDVLPGHHDNTDAIRCGRELPLTRCGPQGGRSCPLRLYWGSQALGVCQLSPNKPCVLTIVLRDPISRMISQYNYVCASGAENRKKWPLKWRRNNYCPLTLLEFVDSSLTSKTALMDRLTYARDPTCQLKIALKNLKHPCMRFLLLENLDDGLIRLAKDWGPVMETQIHRVLHAKPRNKTPYEERTREQVQNSTLMTLLRKKLDLDIQFYNLAKTVYEEQWSRPLQSCNGDWWRE